MGHTGTRQLQASRCHAMRLISGAPKRCEDEAASPPSLVACTGGGGGGGPAGYGGDARQKQNLIGNAQYAGRQDISVHGFRKHRSVQENVPRGLFPAGGGG